MGLGLALALGGCGASTATTIASEPARLGNVGFEVPAGWQRADYQQPGERIAIWTPADNARKESITVIESRAVGARLDDARLKKLLSGAQQALHGARTSQVSAVATEVGLAGYQIEVEFTPSAAMPNYRRTHVVLRTEPGGLVHVIYTARTPDPEREVLETVLSTVHAEAAS
ncbi:MAG: hypothetical protein IPQ07_40240 [Myxococcales bacterium]|nr:hypothetical protein [Myxococcales bacterium]